MDIVTTIRQYMEDNCITYESVAQATGMSRNNLWMRLNKRKDVQFGLIRDLFSALGFKIKLTPREGCRVVESFDLDELLAAPELEAVGFEVVKGLLRACGYDVEVIPPK